MTLGQMKLIENYNSLRKKIGSNEIGLMIQFCSLFQTDDIELFLEFKNKSSSSVFEIIDENSLIELYAKRYNLDSKNDIKEIMYIFIDNAINNGVSYHLNSSANFSSIMETGLGISAIGLKTEERQDYERLEKITNPETFRKLQPFAGEKKGSKLYYSNIPILRSRYGDRPEWLKELKLNSFILEDEPETETKIFVNTILKKYDEKYLGAEKMLFLIPIPELNLSREKIEVLLRKRSPQDIIAYFLHFLTQKDLYTNKHIPSSKIVAIDLNTFDLYFKNENGIISNLGANNGIKR